MDLLQAEKTNAAALDTLANATQTCQDHAMLTFLQPFHLEQTDAVANLKNACGQGTGRSSIAGIDSTLGYRIGAINQGH